MKKVLFTAVLLFTCTLAFNQTSLSGKMTDDKGEPLMAASVKLLKDNVLVKSIFTDTDGNYVFQTLDPGTFSVEFSYIGYQSSRTDGVVVKADSLIKLDVSLELREVLGCGIIIYCSPMINQDPGNTGTTFTTAQLIRKD